MGQPSLLAVLLVMLAGWSSLAELGLVWMPRPQSRWQVPRRWRLLAPWRTGFLYGLGLGPGVTTRIATPAFYVVLIGAFYVGSVMSATAIFLAYALGRWLVVLLLATWPASDIIGINAHVVSVSRGHALARTAIGLALACYLGLLIPTL